ncbi:retrovirus-related pol polyprotein from transposon TNT 1-94 [Tanacetum coccineum]
MKNKIATSQKWQRWFEYQQSFNWSPKSKTAQSLSSETKSRIRVRSTSNTPVTTQKWVAKLSTLPSAFVSCDAGIVHQTSIARTPQQNGVVERRNRTLVKAARTMLIFSKAPKFLWAKAIATACFTQNRSIVHTRYNMTPYELIRGRKPNIQYFHVFGSLCCPINNRDNLGKMKPKADIGIFIGYSESSRGYGVYNRRTKKIMETLEERGEITSLNTLFLDE